MIHLKDELPFKPQLSDLSALVVLHAVVLLLLTHSCGGQYQVIDPPQPIVAMVGDDIILPCHVEPAKDVVYIAVEWARADLKPRFVHIRRDGVELLIDQNPSYLGRTSVSTNKLKCGDVSLKLSKVKLSDEGTYRCFIPELSRDSNVQLVVGAVSSPDIGITKDISGAGVLQCESKGWYPEPEVFWLDGEGNLLPAGPTETVRGPDDLYTVSSRVTVEKRHSNSFTCRVQQNNTNLTRHTHIHVADNVFMVPSWDPVRVSITLAVYLVCSLVVVFIVWKCRCNKTKVHHENKIELGERDKKMSTRLTNSPELQSLSEEKIETGREQLLKKRGKIENLKGKKFKEVKVDDELQKNERELQHVFQVIKTLMDYKKDLKNQREIVIFLTQEMKTQIEESKRKLATPASFDREKKQLKREKAKEDLEGRMKEHEKLLLITEKLLETTEDMIIRMTERKAKLEKNKE